MLISGNGKFSRNLRLARFEGSKECRHEIGEVEQNHDGYGDRHQVREETGEDFD
jgi:hypothetical protein